MAQPLGPATSWHINELKGLKFATHLAAPLQPGILRLFRATVSDLCIPLLHVSSIFSMFSYSFPRNTSQYIAILDSVHGGDDDQVPVLASGEAGRDASAAGSGVLKSSLDSSHEGPHLEAK